MALLFESGLEAGFTSKELNTSKSGSTKKLLNQDAVNKIISDILSSDRGLATLVSGENVAGLSNSSTSSLMSQKLLSEILGTVGSITAETVSEEFGRTKEIGKEAKSKSKIGTIICTKLLEQGKLSPELYESGKNYFKSMSPITIRGYQFWARHVVERMDKGSKIGDKFLPLAIARYEWIAGKYSVLGATAIYVVQPLCFLLGLFVKSNNQGKEHGYRLAK